MNSEADALGFPAELPERDLEDWRRLSPAMRRAATARIAVLTSFIAGDIGIAEAAEVTDLSRSRVYRLAAEWRAAPALSVVSGSVGTRPGNRRFDPAVINALQAKVADVVRFNAGLSVAQLARLLVAEAGITGPLPGAVKLREIVETEIRRAAATQQAGYGVRLDCTAVSLPRADGRPHIMFTCLDVGTRLVLGSSVGEVERFEDGYASAAADALANIGGPFAALPWADGLGHVEIVAGSDEARSRALVESLFRSGVKPQLASSPKRFGAYFRRIVGSRVGRVQITPKQTESGPAVPDNGDTTEWSDFEALTAVKLAAADHNQGILASLGPRTRHRPPVALLTVLGILAEARSPSIDR